VAILLAVTEQQDFFERKIGFLAIFNKLLQLAWRLK
jgi:hypothetical protein